MADPERRRRQKHWYDETNVHASGESGLYFVMHRDIDRLLYKLTRLPLEKRWGIIPQIQQKLEELRNFLTLHKMGVEEDLERTLEEINPWLPGHEILPRITKRTTDRKIRPRRRGGGNPYR